ncbi:hypothetical protein ACT4R0_09450 [Ornithobacterium rhinotracheale]|uniref:hypothetical protein n=1 Tax=Ornithobacterium rhinotracheale TaxID=28251 RepID=UPI004036757D
MKKNLFLATSLFGALALAQQQGKVGINTNSPSETFEVRGTTKITDLPVDGSANAIYNGSDDKSDNFNAVSTVVADENGVLGIIKGIPNNQKKQENVSAPIERCVRGWFSDKQNVGPDFSTKMELTTNLLNGKKYTYYFVVKKAIAGVANLQIMQKTDEDNSSPTWAENIIWGGDYISLGTKTGSFQIKSKFENLVSLSIVGSKGVTGTITTFAPNQEDIDGGGLTFDYRISSKDGRLTNGQIYRFYNACVKMSNY